MRPIAVLVALVTLGWLGCGGGDSGPPQDAGPDAPPDAPGLTAGDFDGLWLMTSLTITDDAGVEQTLRRDGIAQAVRGDVVFTSADDDNGTIDVRQALLVNGLLAAEVMSITLDVTVEPDRWVLTDPDGGVIVLAAELAGDRLTLDLDEADPRNTADNPPRQIVLDRAEPWKKMVVGDWTLVSMTTPSGTLEAGECTEMDPGTSWALISMAIEFDSRLTFERTMEMQAFSDDQCTEPAGSMSSVQTGMAEDVDDTLSIWGLENGDAEFIEFTTEMAGDDLVLTRETCLPSPACEDEAPLEVVVRRPR